MAKAEIDAGICGFKTVVEASMNGEACRLNITSDCPAVRKLAENLKQVDPMREISFRGGMPETMRQGMEHCSHAACPVPAGIVKAIEVEAGLALPADVSIRVFGSGDE